MELQGKIIAALEPRSGVSARGEWKAQDFVVETHESYPHKMVFSVFGSDRLQRFNIQVGQEVLVSFDIDAHEYKDRWFNEISAWGVVEYIDQTTRQANIAAAQQQQDKAADETQTTGDKQGDGNDDLPF